MPDWSRRRFIGNSLALGVTAVAAGTIGRTLLTVRDREAASVGTPPAPVETAPPLPAGASLDVAGITPLVVPNADFYRIDTQLFTPRLNAADWKLTEDREGNMGYVRGFKPNKGENNGIIVRLSREVEARDAALEGSEDGQVGGEEAVGIPATGIATLSLAPTKRGRGK